jgi:hypothetical protein
VVLKLLNKFNADEAIVAAVANDSYVGGGDISITGLSRPPQMRVLEKRHWDEMTEDVSARLSSLKGQVGHGILHRAGVQHPWNEKRIYIEVLGWRVSGQPDKVDTLRIDGKELTDFKFPNLASFMYGFQRDKGLKKEYVEQGNSYRLLLARQPERIEIERVFIKPTLLEWSPAKAAKKFGEYPDRPFFNFEVPLWTLGETQSWIEKRVRAHQAAELLPDNMLPECTAEERWEQPSKYAVKKEGKKNAVRGGLHDTEGAAGDMVKALGAGHYVEHRPGESTRCAYYCRVKDFCHQAKKAMPEGVDMSMAA